MIPAAALLALLPGLLDVGAAVAPRLAGDKDQAERHTADEQKQATTEFIAEFQRACENRTWWDSLIDGLNRLPRPLMVFAVFGLFGYAGRDPIGFTAVMTALAAVPEWLALIAGQIILFFFGGRILENLKFNSASVEQVRAITGTIGELQKLKGASSAAAPPATPLAPVVAGAARTGNPAIDAWAATRAAAPDWDHTK